MRVVGNIAATVLIAKNAWIPKIGFIIQVKAVNLVFFYGIVHGYGQTVNSGQ